MFDIPPFSLGSKEKTLLLTEKLAKLTRFHYQHCEKYKNILDTLQFDTKDILNFSDIPPIPIRLFKETDLLSISKENIFKTMTSSGTSGQALSKIFLDKKTAANQQKVLVKILAEFTEANRLPMLIIDCPATIQNRKMFSARGAGILGFSILGTDRTYALKDDMSLDFEAIETFSAKHRGKKILLFGFTFIIWQHFHRELKALKKYNIDFSNGLLIHGGGWKKLHNESVSTENFKTSLHDICNLKRIHNYYGMVEQTGSIYMECERGHLHASIFSDIIIRNPIDFSESSIGARGLIQVSSILPESYPGHLILTEDQGVLLGIDDCQCGRKGKYFSILGRIKNAELRGCSDTYEQR